MKIKTRAQPFVSIIRAIQCRSNGLGNSHFEPEIPFDKNVLWWPDGDRDWHRCQHGARRLPNLVKATSTEFEAKIYSVVIKMTRKFWNGCLSRII